MAGSDTGLKEIAEEDMQEFQAEEPFKLLHRRLLFEPEAMEVLKKQT